jgi:hypothetical protein
MTFQEFAANQYAPYHTFPEFAEGVSDYNDRGIWDRTPYDGVKAQAYDRGLEAAMRFIRSDQNKIEA